MSGGAADSQGAMKLITSNCTVCSAEFTAPVKRGRQRARCDLHWWRAKPPTRLPPKPVTVMVMGVRLAPCTGIAITRYCRCCGGVFLARLEAAVYCGLNCFARNRKAPPIPASQTVNLRPHSRALHSAAPSR